MGEGEGVESEREKTIEKTLCDGGDGDTADERRGRRMQARARKRSGGEKPLAMIMLIAGSAGLRRPLSYRQQHMRCSRLCILLEQRAASQDSS